MGGARVRRCLMPIFLRGEITGRLQTDMENFKAIFGLPENADIVLRPFEAGGFSLCAVYTEGMAQDGKVADFILRACHAFDAGAERVAPNERAGFLLKNAVCIPQARVERPCSGIGAQILGGMTALLIDGCADALLMETRGFEKRAVQRTVTESVVIGSQEGFVESLRTNITLMRRYVQSPALISEMTTVGTRVPLRIAMLYMKGVAREETLAQMRRRLKCVSAATVQGLGQLEQLIEDRPFSLTPQMLLTERPDRAASCVQDGQIVILADGAPYALIAPVTLFHLLHSSDDTFMRWQYGSFSALHTHAGRALFAAAPGRVHRPDALSPAPDPHGAAHFHRRNARAGALHGADGDTAHGVFPSTSSTRQARASPRRWAL